MCYTGINTNKKKSLDSSIIFKSIIVPKTKSLITAKLWYFSKMEFFARVEFISTYWSSLHYTLLSE